MSVLRILLLACSISATNISSIRAQHVVREHVYAFTDRSVYHAGETIWLAIHAVEEDMRTPLNLSKVVYVELLDTIGKPVAQRIASLKDARGNSHLLVPNVPPGVYLLTAYTHWMKNFGSQCFFKKEVVIVNGNISAKSFVSHHKSEQAVAVVDPMYKIEANKQTYGLREKVKLTLDIPPDATRLTLAIYRSDSLTFRDPEAWEHRHVSVPRGDGRPWEFAPEYNGRLLSGVVIDKRSNKPARGIPVYLTVVGKTALFCNSVSDEGGNILLEIPGFNDADSIIVQAHQNEKGLFEIQLHSPFYEHDHQGRNEAKYVLTNDFQTLITEAFINTQVQRVYGRQNRDTTNARSLRPIDFFGKADVSYDLDEYTRFSKMEEVFREYVAPVAVNKLGARYALKVYAPGEHATFAGDPLVLIDGLPVQSMDTLFAFDPLKIKKIDVLARRYIRNGSIFDGIISLTTYRGNLNGYPVSSTAVVLKDGLPGSMFSHTSPRYSTEEERRAPGPDFQSLLLWVPFINASGYELYTGDLEGTYVAEVRGQTKDGVFVNVATSFIVTR